MVEGYIYIIRRALNEHKKEPIYKVGKTENPNPFQYLNSRYDKGFKLYHLTHVNDVRKIETNLLSLMKITGSQFKLHEGRETFELLGKTDIYDIIDYLLDVIGEHVNGTNVEDPNPEDSEDDGDSEDDPDDPSDPDWVNSDQIDMLNSSINSIRLDD